MIAHSLSFFVRQAGQRGTFSGDAYFLDEINEIFAV